jgi:hypothetical protein
MDKMIERRGALSSFHPAQQARRRHHSQLLDQAVSRTERPQQWHDSRQNVRVAKTTA